MKHILRTVWSAAALALFIPSVALAPATAAPPAPVVYDALGDSYASGFGLPPYSDEGCSRSDGSYAAQIDGRMRIALDDYVACSGATTGDVLATQIDALDEDTDLVTISIGGNDILWAYAVVSCVGTEHDEQCAAGIEQSRSMIQNVLPGLLDTTYAAIREAAPNAHVVVTGYPRLFSPEFGDYLHASPAEQQAMNDGADLLNAVTAEMAAAHGFQFVDVTKRFIGHGLNADDPWIFDVSSPGLFHPNAAGQGAYAAAVTAALNPNDLRR